jgi:riboflavin kinase/FMN adenylyltransferase
MEGRQIGNKIGFPTANLYPENYLILPHTGIYITKTLIDGMLHNSVTNVGYNPTFEKLEKASVETHILDFNDDIYDRNIEVFFIAKIREEKKFNSKEELMVQIDRDVLKAREFFRRYDIQKV